MDQFPPVVKTSHHWLLRTGDTQSLYRQFNRMQGIKVTEHAHLNIHDWLDEQSPQYHPTLAKAIFHYSARTNKDERFEACVAIKEMSEASWTYGHRSQIILDGTFGVCDKKILLFIMMAIDENRKGVPLAFLFFSAPSRNQHMAGGYNTEVIAKLLQKWKGSLGTHNGEEFAAAVAIMDTNLKEQAALACVFPQIWLLICKFHLRQSWRNHCNKILKGNSQAHLDVKNRLRHMEEMLVRTSSIEEARNIISNEAGALEVMRDDDKHAEIAEKGINHLTNYLLGYWTTDALWQSWSDFGRHVAASILKCPFEGVLLTTNHLESFNGLLKRKHLRQWQRSGHRLRLDVLLKLLVTKVFPAIFTQRRLEKFEEERWKDQMHHIPGGEALLDSRNVPKSSLPLIR
jgi:hypothetical protein